LGRLTLVVLHGGSSAATSSTGGHSGASSATATTLLGGSTRGSATTASVLLGHHLLLHLLLVHHHHRLGVDGVAAHLLVGLLGLGLLGVSNLEALVHKGVTVEALEGLDGAHGISVLDESEAAALASLTVDNDADALSGTVHLEKLAELILIDGGGDVVDDEVAENVRLAGVVGGAALLMLLGLLLLLGMTHHLAGVGLLLGLLVLLGHLLLRIGHCVVGL